MASILIEGIERYNSSGRTLGVSELWVNDGGTEGLHIHVNTDTGRGQNLRLTPEQSEALAEYFRTR